MLIFKKSLCSDMQIAALACLPRKLHELLGVLRCVEHLAQLLYLLAGHDLGRLLLYGKIPFSQGQLQGGGSQLYRSAWWS
ncbi:hypothetical protein HFV04_021710 [Pseudomonas sp. BIGb0427]|uniref:hypothetical protein n=1 Tax=Pseudomonas sp. BIGb0427 TaxID=2724470 RepID=UPI0018A72A62|nr:hypothetical protein [Pseudomonas sp. BIGb0427]QPG62119.1 hypothetical protein HFV04_021710 [Pseudomonas sp. BIGb0427]